MNRFTSHSDDIDFRTKTKDQMDACARRGQWFHVMRLGGFKSEEAAREAYSGLTVIPRPTYKPNIKLPERDTTGMVAAAVATPEKVFSVQQGAMVTPASRQWVLKCRGRIAGMGLRIGDVSVSMGRAKSYLSNRFMSTGHCSDDAKAMIDAHLDYLETQVKSS